MMKTDAGTCASLSVSLLTTSSRLSNHFLYNYRRVFKKTALEAENEYFKNKFDTKANSVKKLWSNLNTVCSISKK